MTSKGMAGATLLMLLSTAACAPAAEPVTLRPTTIQEFVDKLESDLEGHEWQSILAAADPTLYRSRVVEARTGEPIFIAETLGLHSGPGRIQDGDVLDWTDFERIQSVEFVIPATQSPPYLLTGTATLDGGEVLPIRAIVSQVQGRFVLTAPAE